MSDSAVIHDRDKKFVPAAGAVIRSEGARVILTPLIVNQRHLEAVLGEYCLHYNDERPHRSRNLRASAARGDPLSGQVTRKIRLGGLLGDYRRSTVAA